MPVASLLVSAVVLICGVRGQNLICHPKGHHKPRLVFHIGGSESQLEASLQGVSGGVEAPKPDPVPAGCNPASTPYC